MKILLIARTCPYPANDGEKIRVFNLIKNLSHHEITLVCRAMTEEEQKGVSELEKYCKDVYAVYIPSPESFWVKLSWVRPFVFSKYPISLSTVFFEKKLEIIQRICNEKEFDIIQIEHSSLTIYLDFLSFKKKTGTVLTMHNIDYVRNSRLINNLSFSIKKIYQLINQIKFKKWELASLKRYDRIITMSDIDRDMLLKDMPSLVISVVPNGVDTKTIGFSTTKSIEQNNMNIIFVASMDSEANHDGAIYFIEHVFPLIKKKIPDAVSIFVGRNPKKELSDKHNGKDIIVTGMVNSVFKYYQDAAVAIVPLRSGGGTRLKILEAMAAGVPVVSTTIGAEGLNLKNNEDILLADSPVDFANCIIKLLGSVLLRKSIIKKGRLKVELEYDWSISAEHSDDLYRSINV